MEQWLTMFADPTIAGLRGKDFISLHDLTPAEVAGLLDLAGAIKRRHRAGEATPILQGQALAMIFQKPSTRTRVSFEVGMWQLGGYALYLNAQDLQLRRGETIQDTARVLSRYVDGILIRTFDHRDVTDLAEAASVPVINGLTDYLHPTQVLCDLLTLKERWGDLRGRTLVYLGDGNNVAHSLMFGGAKAAMRIIVCTPEEFAPDAAAVRLARQDAQETKAAIDVVHDPYAAVAEADAVYTDVWASMGQEDEHDRRVRVLAPYQINEGLLARAKPDVFVLHCLPAHRGEEITDGVIDGPRSIVFDQAENRLHGQKAILAAIMRK